MHNIGLKKSYLIVLRTETFLIFHDRYFGIGIDT